MFSEGGVKLFVNETKLSLSETTYAVKRIFKNYSVMWQIVHFECGHTALAEMTRAGLFVLIQHSRYQVHRGSLECRFTVGC